MEARLRVALVQLTSNNHTSENEAMIRSALRTVEAGFGGAGAELVVFPENVWFMRLGDDEKIPHFDLNSSFARELSEWSARTGAAIILGSVPILGSASADRPQSAQVAIEPGVPPRVVYTKIHLFDVDVAGSRPVRESDHLASGGPAYVWNWKGWKFGCAICYDVRFAELFSIYARAEVDALFLPSAFLVPTGRAHWEILVRARAIESQSYMLAPAQSGEHGAGQRKTYGRSLAVDPWGRVLAAGAAEKTGMEILEIELVRDEIRRVRSQIPMRSHRRLGVN
ncbi:MAG TPA: nitrilase-related carbon-nitrogen hydrolase [Pseudobdellovibrionaceae bacterium]|nr:nitrilase-related carbon-nitrogen hydrolase [Pseudobdellovibrionaceae bacterium]